MSDRVTRKRIVKYESDGEEPATSSSEEEEEIEEEEQIDEQDSEEEQNYEPEESEESEAEQPRPVARKTRAKKKSPPKKKKKGRANAFILEDVDVDDDEYEDEEEIELGPSNAAEARERREVERVARENGLDTLRPRQRDKFASMSEDQMLAYFEDRYGQEPEIDPDQDVSDEELYDDEYEDFTLEEIKALKRRARTRVIKKQSLPFLVGDVVEVTDGEMAKMCGKVQSSSRDTVVVLLYHKDFTKPIPFSPAQLCKFFKVGDHVQITDGVHENMTGSVVAHNANEVIILSDLDMKELKVHPHEVRLYAHVSADGEYKDYRQTMFGTRLYDKQVKVPAVYFHKNDYNYSRVRKAPHKDDGIVGKTVRILQGPMKGYLGIAKDATQAIVRVELHAQPRIITVDRARVGVLD